MKRKKILVDIYLAYNLGDDMFLDYLVSEFPHIEFVPFYPGKSYDTFFGRYNNLTKFPYSTLDKILNRLKLRSKLLDYPSIAKDYDGMLFLGGGIFREESYWSALYKYRSSIIDAFAKRGKPVCFIGCNFGPYNSTEFVERHRDLFKRCTDICFRDKTSYQLFADLPQVRYAPDLLWSYKLPEVSATDKTVGISVVDPSHKPDLLHYKESYVSTHINLVSTYLDAGYNVKLFSFCEAEGDLEIANAIAAGFKSGVSVLNYTGNIADYLIEYGSCSEYVAARFHANIIGFLYNRPVLPIIYGDKTQNLLKDLEFENPAISFSNLSGIKKIGSYTAPETHSLKVAAKAHFEKLNSLT